MGYSLAHWKFGLVERELAATTATTNTGSHLVLYLLPNLYHRLRGLQGMSGQLEFVSADDFETLNAGEHFMCTDVEWDPTGRYVATSTTQIHQMENGFNVWLFNGMPLYR